MHAKTVHVGASLPRNLVDYPAAPSVLAPTHVFCGNSAMNSARVPPRLVKRGSNAELIEFVHLLRFLSLSCGSVVSTAAAGQKQLQLPEPKALLAVEPDLPAHGLGRRAGAWAQGFCALKYFVIDAVESRPRCRRLMRSCLYTAGSLTALSVYRQPSWG